MPNIAPARHLQDLMYTGLQVVCPAFADQFKAMVETKRQMQTAPSVSRHRLSLHCAFLVTLRRVNAQLCCASTPVRYSTCDCSPQAGREWLLSGTLTIPGEALMDCFDAALELIEMQGAECDGDVIIDAESECGLARAAKRDKQQALVRLLENSMTRRPHCPVALGSGRGSVAHKVHALVHAIRLEHDTWAETADA